MIKLVIRVKPYSMVGLALLILKGGGGVRPAPLCIGGGGGGIVVIGSFTKRSCGA